MPGPVQRQLQGSTGARAPAIRDHLCRSPPHHHQRHCQHRQHHQWPAAALARHARGVALVAGRRPQPTRGQQASEPCSPSRRPHTRGRGVPQAHARQSSICLRAHCCRGLRRLHDHVPHVDAVVMLAGGLTADGGAPPWVSRRLDLAAAIRCAPAVATDVAGRGERPSLALVPLGRCTSRVGAARCSWRRGPPTAPSCAWAAARRTSRPSCAAGRAT